MQKRVIAFLIISLAIIFVSLGFISAAWCGIVPRTSCTGGNYTVMGVSGLTNAHGEFPDTGTYSYVLCCDFQEVRGTTCVDSKAPIGVPDNKIIGLSSSTNAHAEIPSQTSYPVNVCYDDLECISTLGSCPTDYPLSMLSLSNYTNAHIGRTGDYPNYQICCAGSVVNYLKCQLINASWEYTQVLEGIQVDLIVKGTDCSGVGISFEVFRQNYILGIPSGSTPCSDIVGCSNPSDAIFIGNTATGTWTASGPDKDYYFIAKVIANPSESANSKDLGNPLLKVTKKDPSYCESIATCGDYPIESECNSDATLCNVAPGSAPPEVNCNDPEIDCTCAWNSETDICEFSVVESPGEGICGNDVINLGETCDGTTFGKQIQCDDFDDFSGGILNCNAPGTPNECQINTSQCTGGVDGPCGNNVTNTGESCDGDDWGQIIGCDDLGFDGGNLSCDSSCYFDVSQCTFDIGGGGTCTYSQQTTDDCEDGFLSYSWVATWNGEGPKPDWCKDGSKVIECPAQVQLPFFNIYSLIAAAAIIALMYILVNLRKKKVGSKKRK